MKNIHKPILMSLTIACVIVAGLASVASPASALMQRNLLSSFGPGGPGTGSFTNVQSMAVDQTTGSVYVFDNGASAIYKFNSKGEPQEFEALKTNAIEGVAGNANPTENQIAVDSSTGPAKGDIYFAGDNVSVYGSNGNFVGTLMPPSFSCGVAVDPAGNVYVGQYGTDQIEKYTPSAKLVTSGDYKATLSNAESVCNVAADGEGNVYSDRYGETGPVTKFSASQFGDPSAHGVVLDTAGATLAVDPFTNDVYVDEDNGVAQFDSAGNLSQRFAGVEEAGAVSGSFGIAVYSPTVGTSYVYLSDGASGRVEIFSPGVTVPDTTTSLSKVQTGAATIEGTVNPDNTTVTSCMFEYGTSVSYGSVAPCESIPPSGNNPVTVTAKLSGLLAGTQYHYRLLSANSNGTSRGADNTFRAPAVVTSRAVSGVGYFSATLNGVIDPGPVPASYHFVYGASSAYGSIAPVPDAYTPVGYAEDSVSQVIGGLEPGTTYHYALVVSDVASTVTGADETFTTPSVPSPTASTGTVGEVTRSSAVVSGSVNPVGWETTYHFEYGTSPGYGASWPTVPVDMGAFNGPQPVLVALENLQPDTTYHYRLVATNPGGTAYGSDQAFTTSSYPVSVIQIAPVGSLLGLTPVKVGKAKAKHRAKTQKHKKHKKRRAKKKR